MKTSTFLLSFFGFCLFYICNADWMDKLYERLIEDYLGTDYEEVAPFVSSVTAGTEEFDKIVREFAQSKRKWYKSSLFLSFAIIILTFSIIFYQIVVLTKRRGLIKASRDLLLSYFCQSRNSVKNNREEIQNLMMEFLENKIIKVGGRSTGDEVPVKLLWKGGSLVESSIHCNIKNESTDSKIVQIQKRLLESKLHVKRGDAGGGDDKLKISPVSSEESTACKMAEIRKLLESEPEIVRAFAKPEDGETAESRNPVASTSGSQRRNRYETVRKSCLETPEVIAEEKNPEEEEKEEVATENHSKQIGNEQTVRIQETEIDKGPRKNKKNSDGEDLPDPKLMNRIRLLESRLRLEELKNKNWINRMSRAEGILQQLNKQVERIEETRPMETRTETLKITSTVTNWASSVSPRRNAQFTLVNQYQPLYLQPPCMSLSEVIKKEIGLPSYEEPNRPLYPLIPISLPISVSSSPKKNNPQSSFLSKFLSR